ncbi:hypothetical protein BBOMB_1588, partial [Bifidobacterium bombi DSM 19703]
MPCLPLTAIRLVAPFTWRGLISPLTCLFIALGPLLCSFARVLLCWIPGPHAVAFAYLTFSGIRAPAPPRPNTRVQAPKPIPHAHTPKPHAQSPQRPAPRRLTPSPPAPPPV